MVIDLNFKWDDKFVWESLSEIEENINIQSKNLSKYVFFLILLLFLFLNIKDDFQCKDLSFLNIGFKLAKERERQWLSSNGYFQT